MDQERIAELLQPFLRAEALPVPAALSPAQLCLISIYVDLLLRWNARINLTAVRGAEDIVVRHFGESLFLAACLFPGGSLPASGLPAASSEHALDLGSGAGFPGLPLKIYVPQLRLTLVESNRKKAVFLAEAIRALNLREAAVFAGRLDLGSTRGEVAALPEGISPPSLVTMRAVERFERALGTAAALARHAPPGHGSGKLALLIGKSQAERVPQLVSDFTWQAPVPLPLSRERVLLLGLCPRRQESRQ